MPFQPAMTKAEAEATVAAKTAPKITLDGIRAKIRKVFYHHPPGTTLTTCYIEMQNGFIVDATSAAASPVNFDHDVGQRIAYDRAEAKLWALEGYLLRECLMSEQRMASSDDDGA